MIAGQTSNGNKKINCFIITSANPEPGITLPWSFQKFPIKLLAEIKNQGGLFMGWERIHVSREELFEKIWSQPTIKLAKEYGISDVGLVKICKKLNVPRPLQGYWLRKYRKQKPALPPTNGPKDHVIPKWVEPAPELTDSQPTEQEQLIHQEKLPENQIRVNENTEELHRLVFRTREQLLKAASKKESDQSFVRSGTRSLDVNVSQAQIDRAIRILDALVTGLEKRKYPIAIKDGQTFVTVLGETFRLSLEEKTTRIDHVPTQQEIKKKEKHSWMTPAKYDFIPTGKLSLKIDKDSYGYKQSWNDGKKRRIEDCLNAVIVGLIGAAFKEKSRRAEKERRKREREEYEKLRQEKQKAIQKEKARLAKLETDAKNCHLSQKLRAYIEAVRLRQRTPEISSDEELRNWLDWATQQADRLDPLVKSPSSILDEEADFAKFRYW
jgi:hypothetical protein